MLSLVVLGAVAQIQNPVSPAEVLTPKDVVAALGRKGYRFEPTNREQTEGRVSRDGATVTYMMLPARSTADHQASPHLDEIVLWITFPVGRDLSAFGSKQADKEPIRPFDLGFTPNLGRTATMVVVIGARAGLSAKLVRTAFDETWRAGAAYARQQKGAFVAAPERDWTKARFADSTLVPPGEMISVVRAMKSWGFTPIGEDYRLLFSSGGRFKVNGTTVAVDFRATGINGSERLLSLYGEVDLPASVNAEAWAATQRSRKLEVVIGNVYGSWVGVSKDFPLRGGVKLGDLRRDVTEFAAAVAGLPRSLPVAP